jgi:hypothetical protein
MVVDRWLSLGLCFVASSLAGCATPMIESVPYEPGTTATRLMYSTPKAQVELKASRRIVQAEEVEKAKKAADDAAAALAKANESVKTLEALVKSTKTELDAAKDAKKGADTLADINLRYELAQVRELLAKRAVPPAEEKATEAEAAYILVSGRIGRWVEEVSLKALAAVPDPEARFVARHVESALRDDSLKLTVANGLLSTGEAAATGQASAVLVGLARIAAAGRVGTDPTSLKAQRLTPLVRSGKDAAPGSTADACTAYDFAAVFDPTDPQAVRGLASELAAKSGSSLKLQARIVGASPDAVRPRAEAASGLFHPALVPVSIVVEPENAGACPNRESPAAARLNVVVPDSRTRLLLPMDGAMFTKSSIKHVFKDGLLTEVSIDRPSTALAIVSLPIDILKALISIPAEIVKLRVDYSTQQTAEVTQQTKLLEAQLALLKAEADLKAKQAADSP